MSPSRPGQIKTLLDALLAAQDPVDAETAIARLAIVGRSAVRHVLGRLDTAAPAQAVPLIRVLERIGDPSALPALRPLLAHADAEVAAAAVDALGTLLDASDAAVATAALDDLTATLLDVARPDSVRLRAWEALVAVPDRTDTYEADVIEPLRQQLHRDASAAIRAAVATPVLDEAPVGAIEGDLDAVAHGQLPDDGEAMRQLLLAQADAVPVTTLHRVVERIRTHEQGLDGDARDRWRVARATAHQALAARDSRLAVYDLRETIEGLGDQTPVGMLSALQQVGDVAALETIVDAYTATDNAWFKGQLTTVFRAIVARERVTRRHAAIKKIAAQSGDTLTELWG